jgi:hypothetical protein
MTALKKGLFTAECAENAEENQGNLCALCALCGEFLAFFSRVNHCRMCVDEADFNSSDLFCRICSLMAHHFWLQYEYEQP